MQDFHASRSGRSTPPVSLIIHNGGFASLLASLMLEAEANGEETRGSQRGLIYAWVPPSGSGLFADEPPFVSGAVSSRTRREMVEQQAKMFGFREVFVESSPEFESRSSVSTLLLRAMELAADHRCERVVWPIAVGDDLDQVQRVTERAALLTDLAALEFPMSPDEESGGLQLVTPLADYSYSELDLLASDLDAPAEACWRPVTLTRG